MSTLCSIEADVREVSTSGLIRDGRDFLTGGGAEVVVGSTVSGLETGPARCTNATSHVKRSSCTRDVTCVEQVTAKPIATPCKVKEIAQAGSTNGGLSIVVILPL